MLVPFVLHLVLRISSVSDLDVTASATRVELRKAMKRKGTERVLLINERI